MQPDLTELENRLWDAADELRANSGLKASEYGAPVLGLIFLRFADARFEAARERVEAKASARRNTRRSALDATRLPLPHDRPRLSRSCSPRRSRLRSNGSADRSDRSAPFRRARSRTEPHGARCSARNVPGAAQRQGTAAPSQRLRWWPPQSLPQRRSPQRSAPDPRPPATTPYPSLDGRRPQAQAVGRSPRRSPGRPRPLTSLPRLRADEDPPSRSKP